MSDENSYYYDEIYTDRAADAGIYDEFEGVSTGKRSKKATEKKGRKKTKKGKGRQPAGKSPMDRKKRKRRTAIIVVVCLALLLACGFVLAKHFVKDKFNQVNRVVVNEEDWGIDPRVKEELKDYKNIVLLGVDTRESDGETDDDNVRSDAIIIVTINKKTNDITMTSVMRDSYLDIEENNTHVIDKVTHAHAYGGPVNTVRALNRNLDLNIDDYVRVDWRAVAEITDAMGGLDVTVDEGEFDELNKIILHTDQNLHMDDTLVDHVGSQTLNGVQIVAYCRIRYNDGDSERTERMREVIKAAIDKAKTMKLSELNNLLNLGMSKITTSMSSDTMMDMVLNLSKFGEMGSQRFPFEYEGAYLNAVWYDAPVTLKSNVVQLHEVLFGQVDYQPTDNVLMINEEVKIETQYYGDEDIDYDLLQRYVDTFGGGPNGGQSLDGGYYYDDQQSDDYDYTEDYDNSYDGGDETYYEEDVNVDSGGETYYDPPAEPSGGGGSSGTGGDNTGGGGTGGDNTGGGDAGGGTGGDNTGGGGTGGDNTGGGDAGGGTGDDSGGGTGGTEGE